MKGNFNVRVYGLWLRDGSVWTARESYAGKRVVKFPGGGLEYGEGITDCLIREWKEETDCMIRIIRHYYTTDFFQLSVFDNSQVISIYYLVEPVESLQPEGRGDTEFFWTAIRTIRPDSFSLPIDRHVGLMLQKDFSG